MTLYERQLSMLSGTRLWAPIRANALFNGCNKYKIKFLLHNFIMHVQWFRKMCTQKQQPRLCKSSALSTELPVQYCTCSCAHRIKINIFDHYHNLNILFVVKGHTTHITSVCYILSSLERLLLPYTLSWYALQWLTGHVCENQGYGFSHLRVTRSAVLMSPHSEFLCQW